LGLKILFN